MLKKNDGSRSPLSVLLVENDLSVAKLVTAALTMEGYLVIGLVASLDEARRIVHVKNPDLIISDGRMIPRDKFD